jgi:6-phosphogluconolactonase
MLFPKKPISRGDSGSSSFSGTPKTAFIDAMGANSDQLFFVTSYSDFEKLGTFFLLLLDESLCPGCHCYSFWFVRPNMYYLSAICYCVLLVSSSVSCLAHGPRGTEAKHSLYVYRFHSSDGSLVLLNVQGDPKTVMNPAFSRYHPQKNIVYTCTEDIEENGKIFAYAMGSDGELKQLGEPVDAGGTSTCYLTVDRAQKNLLAVNYWDSTLVTIPLCTETGAFKGPVKSKYDPKGGKGVVAAAKKNGGVNHSLNDESTIRMRQADPHSHALVLDPYVGTVAYVPDLGKDLIREFFYDRDNGAIEMELNYMPSGLCSGMPDGPRYLHFHPKYNVAYVVNELSSTVSIVHI